MTIRKNMKHLLTYNLKSRNPQETFDIAKNIGSKITGCSLLIGVTGELGAGKTIFAKGFAEGLGIKELITSPTFLGISEYYSGRIPFIHMDFYKKIINIENIKSYLKINSVVFIEWIENAYSVFKNQLNPDIRVYIHYLKDNEGNMLDNENEREIIIMIY